MWGRIGLSIVLGLFFALPSLSSYALINQEAVGRAMLSSTTSSVSGEAYARRMLTTGDSNVMLNVTGLTPGSQPVWRLSAGGTTVITPSAPLTVSSLGRAMSSTTVHTEIPVSAVGSPPIGVSVCIYESVDAAGNLGPVLACGSMVNQPDTGTSHSW
jgi:hypothetical protein